MAKKTEQMNESVEKMDGLSISKNALFIIANSIKDLQLKNLEYYENITNTKKRCDIVRNSIMNVITNEVDEKCKKVYSNADSRQNEFEIRIKDNAEYSNDITFIKQLEDTIAKNNIEISYNDRLFRYYEILCK